MAPKIRVPADFGRENINKAAHGNLTLKLRDGGQIKTNSMIMSLNSPVIDRLTTDLSQSTLEMDDFPIEAVDCFVDSLYTGEIDKLEKIIFERVNKMAHAFKVSWLSRRCLRYYQTVILNFEKNTYEEIVSACEIASRAHSNLKQKKYVGLFVKSASTWKMGKGIFLQRYMTDFANLSKRQLDMSLAIARDDLSLVVNFLTSYFTIALGAQTFDKNSFYVLENLDLQKWKRQNPSHFSEFMCFILEISGSFKNDRINPILKKFSEIQASCGNEDNGGENSLLEPESEDLIESDLEDLNIEAVNNLKSISIQTEEQNQSDWKLLSGWGKANDNTMILLPLQEFVIEMTTTKNDVDNFIQFLFEFPSDAKTYSLGFYMQCDSASPSSWSYALTSSTKFELGEQFLKQVPNDKVKSWVISKTSTHLKVLCNGVTVLNYNFEDDCIDKHQEKAKLWAPQPISVKISTESSAMIYVRAKKKD